jgi:frataxin-like iron-binding protein CyaY
MAETVHLEERITDSFGEYWQVWHVAPPAEGVKYRVLKDQWSTDQSRRDVYAIFVPQNAAS